MLWSEYKNTFKSFPPTIFSEVHLWEELKWVISQNTTISNSDDPYKLQPKMLILWSVFYLCKERTRVIKMKVLYENNSSVYCAFICFSPTQFNRVIQFNKY